MGIVLSEHCEVDLFLKIKDFKRASLASPRQFPSKKGIKYCYVISESNTSCWLKADYYIGVDWIIKGEHFIQVKPKLNTKIIERFEEEVTKDDDVLSGNEVEDEPTFDEIKDFKELNFLKILLDAFQHSEITSYTDNLVLIDWEAPQIEIKQRDDALTPFLVVKFLNTLKHLVRKGLKKSYYKVQENLNNRVKGKILVGANIKQNVLKNRLTKTYCEYQPFGIDHQENRFLKKVLYFCSNYVHQYVGIWGAEQKQSLEHLISYCKPAFELVSDDIENTTLKNIKHNPFFQEYKEAIKIGGYILKRFAYNISNTSESETIKTPPFWIDMPKLFELYVYHHLHKSFPNNVEFQFATYGNVLDFLITAKDYEMVVDAKYKMHYRSSHIHEDIRQVAGYARLNKVYEALKKPLDSRDMIKCLIIYPCTNDVKKDEEICLDLTKKLPIQAYRKVFKIGIPMPFIT
ncbi:5-methylcytosine restriction system specificity protein McrC [Desertivirga arenae]|uniref:5-methylcytosine restriction system specificity protein McrC n=1 Tax=Desertivirga arenae TaxID=2810309 RepID=UPI001A9764BE|nr:hypothetical protein [Pedobacter sp. SYSU D00823]